MSEGTKANPTWIVSQLGAREHYAIPRALHRAGCLNRLVTDFWCPPTSWIRKCRSLGRLHERWHEELTDARVASSASWYFREELAARLHRSWGWDRILRRNDRFQAFASKQIEDIRGSTHALFSYSYTARQLLPVARSRGWVSVVGQIDPGPEEERIVQQEHERYSHVTSAWRPAPSHYWDQWHEEMDLCDRIVVNSSWSAQCLAKEGIAEKKVSVIPLVYSATKLETKEDYPAKTVTGSNAEQRLPRKNEPIEILFLGQINLRKGIGRLVDAMRLLSDDRRFRLTLAGPSEVDTKLWASLPNVRWIGPLKRSEVSAVYRNADVFILPTLSDGYALTQLEAFSHGLPVIASRYCGNAVLDQQNGLILGDLEPETIASTICRIPELHLQVGRTKNFGVAELGQSLVQLAG